MTDPRRNTKPPRRRTTKVVATTDKKQNQQGATNNNSTSIMMAVGLVLFALFSTPTEAFAPKLPFLAGTRIKSEAAKGSFLLLKSPRDQRRLGNTNDRSSVGPSTSTSRRYKESTVDQPPPMSDFQERMRKLVTGGSGSRQSDGSTTTTSATRRPRNVQEVQTLQEYRRVVSDEADKLVVVRFYATWCKACRAVAPSFYRMARDFPGVKFVEVPVTDTSIVIHQGLGVEKLPYLHMYHPQAGLVEELRFKRRQVPTALAKLQSYVEGECKLGPDVSSPYEESATTKTTGRP